MGGIRYGERKKKTSYWITHCWTPLKSPYCILTRNFAAGNTNTKHPSKFSIKISDSNIRRIFARSLTHVRSQPKTFHFRFCNLFDWVCLSKIIYMWTFDRGRSRYRLSCCYYFYYASLSENVFVESSYCNRIVNLDNGLNTIKITQLEISYILSFCGLWILKIRWLNHLISTVSDGFDWF